MRTIIHIGQHKTGTTSLQHYLRNNREKLLNEGLYIPNLIIDIDHPSHYILNVYSLNKDRYSPMKEYLLKNKSEEYFNKLEDSLLLDIKKHYKQAKENSCSDIIWTNEGLYLLNSREEYTRLVQLFEKYSSEVLCVCTFREKKSYRNSYINQLKKQNITFNQEKDSYRFVGHSSWLFNYENKKKLLNSVFEKTIFISYNNKDMISTFMRHIGYKTENTQQSRLNIS